MQHNLYLFAKIGFDTAESETFKILYVYNWQIVAKMFRVFRHAFRSGKCIFIP